MCERRPQVPRTPSPTKRVVSDESFLGIYSKPDASPVIDEAAPHIDSSSLLQQFYKESRVSRAQSPMKIVHGPSPHIRTDALMMEHVKKVADQRVPSSTRGPMSYRPDASNPPHVNGDALMLRLLHRPGEQARVQAGQLR